MNWNALLDLGKWFITSGALYEFYSNELRSEFFNGFLALAGFMLAALTFIVIHMKREVYDHPQYESDFDERKRAVGQSSAKRYGPLERMSNALYWIVVSSVIAAICQVTIGLIPVNLAAIVCMFAVAFGVWKLISGLVLMKQNLRSWFDLIHKEEAKREDSLRNNPEAQE